MFEPEPAPEPYQPDPRYVLHFEVRITARVSWTIVTDADGNTLAQFASIPAALEWLAQRDVFTVNYQSGEFAGILVIGYDTTTAEERLYNNIKRYRLREERNNGKDNRPTSQFWSKWHNRWSSDL